MKILITGASGHLGLHLVSLLTAENEHEITAFALDATTAESLKKFHTVKKVDGDICDSNALESLIKDCNVVYHLAAMVPPILYPPKMEEKMVRVNVLGTQTITDLAIKHNTKRFIYLSTIHTYEKIDDHKALDETGEPLAFEKIKSISPYDKTKTQAERVVKDAIRNGLNGIIIQPTGVIGPSDYQQSPTNYILYQAAKGKIGAVPEGGFNWVDVRDVAETLKNTLTFGKIGESYILAGEWADLSELVTLSHKVVSLNKKLKIIPIWLLSLMVPPIYFFSKVFSIPTGLRPQTVYSLKSAQKIINDNKARSELKHTTRSIIESVKDTILWRSECNSNTTV